MAKCVHGNEALSNIYPALYYHTFHVSVELRGELCVHKGNSLLPFPPTTYRRWHSSPEMTWASTCGDWGPNPAASPLHLHRQRSAATPAEKKNPFVGSNHFAAAAREKCYLKQPSWPLRLYGCQCNTNLMASLKSSHIPAHHLVHLRNLCLMPPFLEFLYPGFPLARNQ